MLASLFTLVAAAGVASAHFQIEYPPWRADSLTNTSYSQYVFPCAGVPQDVENANRTDWPVNGGSLSLDLHHPWTYVFINIGLGENVTNFNYSITPSFWNETGSGVLCVPHLDLPADLQPADGQKATIQVVTLGESGSALYNCADITFRTSNVANFGGNNCTTDAAVSYTIVGEQTGNGTSSSGSGGSATTSGSGSSATTGSSTTGTNAGAASGVNKTVLTSVVALAVAFMYGMSA